MAQQRAWFELFATENNKPCTYNWNT